MAEGLLTRRLVYSLSWLAPAWALTAIATGGVGWMIGPLRISSRDPIRPLIVGLAVAAFYAWRYPRLSQDEDSRWFERHVRRSMTYLVPAVVVLTCVIGIRFGSFAAAGSDSYGYVSQAALWLRGNLHIEQPWVREFSWPNREWAFAPLGYRPISADGTIVPTYAPGLPILMAVFLGVSGSNGPFFVVPMLGALAVWSTWLLGREVTGSRAVGAAAAAILLTAPVFLGHLMLPMTDVPVAAGWTLVCVLALKEPRPRPLAAGLVAGLTLLIRPNLLLLAAAPVLAWVWCAVRQFAAERDLAGFRRAGADIFWFGVGLSPAAILIAALNTYLYGSPLVSGYGSLGDMYWLSSAPPNLRNYWGWLVQSQSWLVAFALLPFLVPSALRVKERASSAKVGLGALCVLTLLSYVFYSPFDVWFYLRFLLPAIPALIILMVGGIRWIALRLPLAARGPVAVLLCLACAAFGFRFARDQFIFSQRAFEQRHVRAAHYVRELTTPKAVILAVQHSGSVRYYADRITLRYDWIAEDQLDAAIRDLLHRGYRPYIVIDDWEETDFRRRFAAANRVGKLDWRPLVRVIGNPEVRIYDPEGRAE